MTKTIARKGGDAAITELYQRRRVLVRARTSLLLQMNAQGRHFARRRLEASGKSCDDGVVGKDGVRTFLRPEPIDMAMVDAVFPALRVACTAIDDSIKMLEKELKAIVRSRPIWTQWAVDVGGLGELSVAAIIGSCGNPADYRGPAALWKRFGLGFAISPEGEQVRQRKTTDAAMAVLMGYSPERRSTMHVIGECLVRAKKQYYQRYCTEKEAIAAVHPELTKGHIHRRAMRKMEKRLLADIWVTSRRLRGENVENKGDEICTVAVAHETLAA